MSDPIKPTASISLPEGFRPTTITVTTQISISTNPAVPLFGGGTGNIAFLQERARRKSTERGRDASAASSSALTR